MAGDDEIGYYGKPPLFTWLRRGLIAIVIGFAAAWLLATTIELACLVFADLKADLEHLKSALDELGVYIPLPPLSWRSVVPSGVALGAVAYVKWSRRVDFFLFSPFDQGALRRLKCHTGILVWQLPEKGREREVWDTLRSWAFENAGDGRWRTAWRRSAGFQSFAWTALLGPNGCGKTQLAKELGRALAQRTKWGSSGSERSVGAVLSRTLAAYASWLWRVVPFVPSQGSAWDAGMIESANALVHWQPRAPTLLLLDDPAAGVTREVIKVLARASDRFSFPVRLIVIDQFVSADWPVTPNAYGAGWHYHGSDREFAPAILETKFDAGLLRAAAHRYWTQEPGQRPRLTSGAELPALFSTEGVDKLVAATEGNPLLLALAVLWLGGDRRRTVDALLSTDNFTEEEGLLFRERRELKELVAHRLLQVRVQELYEGYHGDKTSSSAALAKMVACATLAGGLDYTTQTKQWFGLRLKQDRLRRLFAHAEDDGAIDVIPPIRPWLMGEAFVHMLRRDVYTGDDRGFSSEIIERAFEANPEATFKAMARKGQLAAIMAATVASMPLPEDPDRLLVHFSAFARHALFDDAESTARVLQLAAALPANVVHDALRELSRLEAAMSGADPVVSGIIHCALFARQLSGTRVAGTDTDLGAACDRLRRWLLGVAPFSVLDATTGDQRELLASAFGSLLEQFFSLIQQHAIQPERFTAFVEIDDLFARLPRLLMDQLVRTAEQSCRNEPEWSLLWRLRAHARTPNLASVGETAASLDALLIARPLPSDQAALLRARAHFTRAWVLSHVPDAPGTEGAARLVDEVVAPFAAQLREHPALIEMQAAAWGHVALARCRVPEQWPHVEDAARRVDAILEPFKEQPTHPALMLQQAAAWSCVAYARCKLLRQRSPAEDAARQVDSIVSPFAEEPLKYPAMIEEQAAAWCHVACAPGELPEQQARVEHAARRVDAIVSPFAQKSLGYPAMVKQQVSAWRFVALRRCLLPEQRARTEEVALHIDAIAAPFGRQALRYPEIFEQQAWAWRLVAGARCLLPEQRARVHEAARRIDVIAAPFAKEPLKYPEILVLQASAWRSVAFAHCYRPEPARAEGAARRVDAIVAPFTKEPLKYPEILVEQASAWSHVALARCQHPEQRAHAEEAARRVDAIVVPFAEEPLTYSELFMEQATAWRQVVLARSLLPAQRARTDEAAVHIDAIVAPFASQPLKYSPIIRQQAEAWRLVTDARSELPDQRGRAEEAARRVDAIVAPFASQPLEYSAIIGEQARAWRLVAFARSGTPDQGAGAADAARRVDTIAAPFVSQPLEYPLIVEDQKLAWQYVAQACGELATKSPA